MNDFRMNPRMLARMYRVRTDQGPDNLSIQIYNHDILILSHYIP